MKKTCSILVVGVLLLGFSACSVHMAATQPDKKNLNILQAGRNRVELIAEFGNPVATSEKDGKRTDVFRFKQGYSGGVKAARAVTHGVLDVVTLGLWEVIGTPTEGVANGEDVSYLVVYDGNDVVTSVTQLGKTASSSNSD